MKTLMLAAVAAGAAVLFAGAANAQMGNFDPAAIFKMQDTNGDGKLSPAEVKAAREARFARMDQNHDGVLSSADAPAGAPAMSANPMMAQMDKNKDGKIDKAEFTDTTAYFAQNDKNKDGFIDMAEFTAAMQAMRPR